MSRIRSPPLWSHKELFKICWIIKRCFFFIFFICNLEKYPCFVNTVYYIHLYSVDKTGTFFNSLCDYNGGDLIRATCRHRQNQKSSFNSLHSFYGRISTLPILLQPTLARLSTNSVLCPMWHHWAGELETPPLNVCSLIGWFVAGLASTLSFTDPAAFHKWMM